MIEHGTGRIINMSSPIGETGNIGQVNYAASKSGLFGLTKSLAKETLFQLSPAQHPVGDGAPPQSSNGSNRWRRRRSRSRRGELFSPGSPLVRSAVSWPGIA